MQRPDLPQGGPSDFDFLVGSWTVAHRRLKQRFSANPEWEEFPGFTRLAKKLSGLANVDENVFPTKDCAGMTMRLFNPAERRWSIWWISTEGAVLTPPVQGGFTGTEGHFYGEDRDESGPLLIHFRWNSLGLNAARWQQTFTRADGRSETNWVMDFTRTAF